MNSNVVVDNRSSRSDLYARIHQNFPGQLPLVKLWYFYLFLLGVLASIFLLLISAENCFSSFTTYCENCIIGFLTFATHFMDSRPNKLFRGDREYRGVLKIFYGWQNQTHKLRLYQTLLHKKSNLLTILFRYCGCRGNKNNGDCCQGNQMPPHVTEDQGRSIQVN
jgi:hypothetical protein